MKEAGLKEVYILVADELTQEQEREFIVKDNVGFGEWDWDILANDWNGQQISDWGLTVVPFEDSVEEVIEQEINKQDKKTINTCEVCGKGLA